LDKSLKLYCYNGSKGAEYAKENGLNYEIIKAIASPKTVVSGVKSYYIYTGKLIKPTVTVKYGKATLQNGKDYTVSYKKNRSAGLATVVITGKNGYAGTLEKTFKIIPTAEKITGIHSPGTKQIRVAWSKNSQATGYQILYSSKSNFSTYGKVSVAKTETAKTITKSIVSGRTYYVKVRAFKKVGGKPYFGKFSAVKTVTAK
jgi:hypothetical protein